MTTLITGAAGFIGAALSARLLERGEFVVGIDNFDPFYSVELKRARVAHVRSKGAERFDFREVDFADIDGLRAGLESCEFTRIVHLGAQPGVRYSIENPHAYVRANLNGHLNLLELAREREVEHMAYASSSSVYGRNTQLPYSVSERVEQPASLYAATKRADEIMSEAYAHLFRLPLSGLRFFTVYGPWGRPDMLVWKATRMILAEEPIPMFNNGEMARDFTYIDDIVSGIENCLNSPPPDDGKAKPGGSVSPHAIYNLGNHRSEPLSRVIEVLEAACGKEAILDMQPMQPGDVLETFADTSEGQVPEGFVPATSIDEGIPAFVEWYRQYSKAH